MDPPLSKTRRLKALDQAYQPSPRTRRQALRVNLSKGTRAPRHIQKRSIEVKPTQPPSTLPLVSTRARPKPLISPSHRLNQNTASLLSSFQQANTSTSTLNQSSTTKSVSGVSLHLQQRSHGGELPTLATIRDEVHYPLTAGQALKRFMTQMTEYEQAEVLEYKQIYFLGLNATKLQPNLALANCGFDDDRADYKVVLGDHIAYRYEVLGTLGKGSFGQVLRCVDHKRNEVTALKIIRNKRRFHIQGAVEIKVLETLRDHDIEDAMGVIRMKNFLVFRKHICITFELLSLNLYEFLQANNFQGLSLGLIRRFAVQLLVTLSYVKENAIIHCDLKPENILLKQPSKSGIKVIDFGSACFEDSRVYTYIQSRFYRAPEIMLGIPYTSAIDIWSFGCILAELYYGYPLFPGESEKEQLLCIMEICGVPPPHVLAQSTRVKLFFDEVGAPRIVPNSRGKVRTPSTKKLEEALQCEDAAFLNLLRRCFDWDPVTRITPLEALQHPWLVETTRPPASSRPSKLRRRGSRDWSSGATLTMDN